MRQMTIRGYDSRLELEIRRVARAEGISLNQAALRLLRRGAGIADSDQRPGAIGDGLDRFIGTWSDEEAAELMRAVEDFERADEALWR
jgi:hypothetical protein